jgi:aminoglycoside phosphotransferase family enzyme/predicted kinase
MAATLHGPGTPDGQADVVAFLEEGNAFEGTRPARIDTHCATIFLAGDQAWKLKRAVELGYLDFSTPDKRHAALEAELRLNRRTAPDLYRGLHAVTRESGGLLAIDGTGDVVDWLLEMRRFPDDALLTHQADGNRLDERLLIRLADRISAFHSAAEIDRTRTGAASFRRVVEGNITSMAAFSDILDPDKAKHLGDSLLQITDRMAPLLDSRAREGRVRHGHGDLHLANIALVDGEPTLFDCLEFSVELATIDVLYDLAFLLMDLWHRDLHTEANIVFNRYLDLSQADESGLELLPLFLSVRAAIRAHVLAAQSFRASRDMMLAREARSYLDLALAMLAPVPARLVAIGGLSGTGKSSLARRLGGALGHAPGARILRNDVLRKRLAGLSPEARLPRESYSPQAARRVYETTDTMAASALAVGQSAVADAVFAQPVERGRIEAVARQLGVAFDGIWLEAPVAARLGRVETRAIDASDADVAVAQAQSELDIGDLGSWHIVQAGGSPDETAANARLTLKLG